MSRRVAVLVCGVPPPAVLADAGTYGDMFAALLRPGAHGRCEDWRSWDVYKVPGTDVTTEI